MNRKSVKYKWNKILFPLLFLFFCFTFFSFLEKQFLPPLKEISHMQCKTAANDIIDHAVLKNMQTLDTGSFILQDEDSYTANTAMINHFCALLSNDITAKLQELPSESIRIPLGAATNLSLFVNMGPEIPFSLVPMGAVSVDYETAFTSTGINQVNYKIWLHISMEMKIVNPLYQEVLRMERKIMLADLIFSGKVPEHYFQMTRPDEYLLTE